MEPQPSAPTDRMSFSLTYTELVNIAIPQVGVINFKALHLLLQGILDHIHIAELKKVLTGDEDFLQNSAVIFTPREGDAQPIINPMKRLGNVFDHVVDRMDRMESQLSALQDMPSTIQLLEGSQGASRPAEALWHLIKIRKMVEGNEEALAKSMTTLQDLLTDIHALKVTAEALRKDVDMLKDIFLKMTPEKVDGISKDLKSQHQKMNALQREMLMLQDKVVSAPKIEDTVLWSGLHEAMFPRRKSQNLEDSDLWKIAEEIQMESAQQITECPTVGAEAAGYGQVQEAIQSPKLFQTVCHGPEASKELQEEESTQAIPLPEAQVPGEPQEPEPKPGPATTAGPWPVPGPGMSQPGFMAGPWPAFRPGPVPGPASAFGPGPAIGPGQAFGPGPASGPGPALELGPALGPGPVPGLVSAPDTQPIPPGFWPMPPGGWPPRGFYAPSHWPPWGVDYSSGLPGQPQSSRDLRGPSKPWPLPYQAEGLPPLSENEQGLPPEVARVTQSQASRDGAPDVPPKRSPSALKRIKTSASAAAAAAAAYAAAAVSAAKTVRAAVKLVQDVPATKMATKATTEATRGPLGVFADELGAGPSRGATKDLNKAFQGEDVSDAGYEDFSLLYLSMHAPSDPFLAQAMLSASEATTLEEKKEAIKMSLSHIAQMPIRHDSLKEEVAQLSFKLQQRLDHLSDIRTSSKLGMTVDMLQDKIDNLSESRMKEEELERVWGHQIEVMKDHYIVLNKAMENVQIRLDELKSVKAQIRKLEMNKADKKLVEKELSEKADRGVLAGKASRVDLETAAVELNELIQSVLLKVMGHEDGWKKAVEQLRKDLQAKLPQHDLDSLRVEMDQVWMVMRKLLMDGIRFDPDSAAGFRKKLFERVKCISCDRQVDMMSSPQLITVRKAQLLSRLRPASADSYESLQRQQMREQQLQQLQDLRMQQGGLQIAGPLQDWGDGPATNSHLKTRSRDLMTLYPYGDPEVLDYDTAEVDLLGVDGILYKGRMSDQDGAAGAEKELAAVKFPHPPLKSLDDRSRLLSSLAISSSLHPYAGVRSATLGLHQTMPAQPPSLPPLTLLPRLPPSLRDPLLAPGPARHPRPLRFETRTNILPTEEPTKL